MNVRISYGITILCAIWTIASIFTLGVRGHLSKPWDVVDGSSAMVGSAPLRAKEHTNVSQYGRWLGIEIVSCTLEFSLWVLSIYFIWNLHMPLSKRLSVAAIFGSRLL